jgi:RND family efflux transporter MFP subunit
VAQVRVQTAESKPQTINEEVVGTVRAKLRAILEAKVSGRIDQLPVVLGQKVKAGQLVAHLDAAEIKARLDQAQASQDQSERDWQRASALLAGQAMTRSDYEAAESRKQVATAALAEAQAIMGYVEITAPFEGVVTKKWADRGDLATPGKPLIEIEDPAELQLEADVPEAIASRVKAEARLAVQVDSASGELIGTVREIAPTADPASRTFRVKMDLSPPAGLSAGQFARLIVPVGETSSLRVPLSAVVQRGQLEIVFSVTNERARLHLVKTGKRSGAEIEILSGLKTGVTVVVGGAEQLADGQAVAAK